MKYIFDIDGVLFYTDKFVKHEHFCLGKVGISTELAESLYKKNRGAGQLFSLKKFIKDLSEQSKLSGKIDEKILFEKIMGKCESFVNKKLLKFIKKAGKKNCYVVSYGGKEFQTEKMKRAKLLKFFKEVIIVPGSKRSAVEKICAKYSNEPVIFIDDKATHFEDLDFKKCQNLKTILYTGQKLDLC